jgi:hypothetical protein
MAALGDRSEAKSSRTGAARRRPLSRARALLLAHDLIKELLSPAQLGDGPAMDQDRLENRVT